MAEDISEWLGKFDAIRDDIRREKGPLVFFGLIEREELPGVYDLVLSGPWVIEETRRNIEYVVEKAKARLKRNDFTRLSSIVVLRSNEPFIRRITRAFGVENASLYGEFRNVHADGIEISHAYVFDSDPLMGEPSPSPPTQTTITNGDRVSTNISTSPTMWPDFLRPRR